MIVILHLLSIASRRPTTKPEWPHLFSPLTHGVWEDNKSGQIRLKRLGQTELRNESLLQVTKGVLNKHNGGEL
jgi:hypothetical protein